MATWESQMVDNNQLTTISELTPHTIYTIRVQAFTSVGPGPLSVPVLVKTQQGGRSIWDDYFIRICCVYITLLVYNIVLFKTLNKSVCCLLLILKSNFIVITELHR